MYSDDDSKPDELPPLPDPGGVADSSDAAFDRKSTDPDDASNDDLGLPPLPMPGGSVPPVVAPDATEPEIIPGAPSDIDISAASEGDDDSVRVVMPHEQQRPRPAPVPSTNNDPFLGQTYGGYELVEPIGRGGMGMVYKGVQVSLAREVAVKLLNKALVDNDEFIKRFQREARAMASIHHSNIVSVIDFGQQDGVWYMVAEFVEGTNLARMIREKLMVPPEELIPLAVHCLSGLAHVAKSKVIHRDIKPDNILIDKDGVAKIADFGLAKDLSKDETDLTAAGSAMGTPSYMSPEQCMGHSLDGRSDIYSLGVTLYYALTGEKPFAGRSSFDVMTKQREYMPPPVHKVNPQVPKKVSALVEKMMAKAPNKRPDDAGICREEWLVIGTEMGCFKEVTRSGEFLFNSEQSSALNQSASVAYPDDQPPPPLSLPEGAVGLPDDVPAPLVDSNPATRPPSDIIQRPPTDQNHRPSSEAHVGSSRDRKVPTDREPRSTTQKRRTSGIERRGAVTCPKCGTLNRETRAECEKCGHPLNEQGAMRSSDSQLRQADVLFKKGEFRDSAAMYSKLADSTDDRRQRAVLRAKEREARNKLDAERLDDLHGRLTDLERRKQYKEAEQLLLRHQKESSASSVVMMQISDDLKRVRKVARRGKRNKIFIILFLIIAGAVAAAYATKDQWIDKVPFEIPGLSPPVEAGDDG